MNGFDPVAFAQGGQPKPKGFDPEAFAKGTTQAPAIKQEMHPDIDRTERWAIKNLGTDPAQSINYLKKNHPDMEFSQQDDQILMKKPGEASWSVLDPKGLEWEDAFDIGADVVTGIGTGAATVAGGLAGNLPGAVAAGTGSSAALETLRQGLGRAMGVNQEMSGSDIALSAAMGGAAPLLMGTGATAAQIAKEAVKKGTTEAAVKETQRGLIGRALPTVNEYLSGVPAKTFSTMRDKLDDMLKYREMGAGEAKAMYAEEAREKLTSALTNHRTELQNRFGAALDKSGYSIKVGDILEPVQNRIADLDEINRTRGTASTRKELSRLKSFMSDITPTRTEEVLDEAGNVIESAQIPIDEMSAKDATGYLRDLRAKLESIGAMDDKGKMSLQRVSEGNKLAADTMMATYRRVSNQLDDAMKKVDPDVRKDYATFKNIERTWLPKLSTPEKTDKFLRSLNTKDKQVLAESMKSQAGVLGTDIQQNLDEMAAMGMYLEPSWAPISAKGATSTSRTIGVAPILGSLGYSAAEAAGSKNPFIWSGLSSLGTNLVASPGAQFAATRAKEGIRKRAESLVQSPWLKWSGMQYGGTASPWQMIAQPRKGGE